jgi:hypothetical protein
MPVTAKQFRQIALSFPNAEQRSHMRHPDFRVGGKIFATLGYPDKGCGMVKLTPEQQAELTHDEPEMFVAAAGAWGRKGSAIVQLKTTSKAVLQRALAAAWRNIAPEKLGNALKPTAD